MSGHRILVRGGHVVTMDSARGNIADGDVLIDDGTIVAVGSDLGVTDAEIIDATGKIVAPGMVDAHRHSWQTQLRGCCSDMTLAQYLHGFWGDAVRSYTPEDARLGVLAGMLESLDAGVTTVYEFSHVTSSPAHADACVDALDEAGLRAVYAYGLGQVDPLGPPEYDRQADLARLADERFAADGLLTLGVGLSEIGLVPISTTVAQKRLANELGAVSAAHIGPDFALPTGVAELAAGGVLDERLICAHVSTPSEADWLLLADAGVKVVSTPETEVNLGAKPPMIATMLGHAMTPAIGTDISTLTRADVLAATRLALSFTRLAQAEPSNRRRQDLHGVSTTAAHALRWATVNGADALGLGHRIGSLSPGLAADVIVVGGAHLGARPINDPVGQLLFQTTPEQVETVLVNGKFRKRDGRLVDVDVELLLARLEDSADRVREQMALQERRRSSEIADDPVTRPPVDMASLAAANLAS